MAADNIATVKKVIDEAYNKGNYVVLGETLTPNHKSHDPFWGDSEGLNGAEQQIRTMRSAFPDYHMKIDDVGTAGDKLFLRWTMTGTHRGAIMGIPPTNRKCTVSGFTLVRFDGGRSAEAWNSWDTYGFLAAIGVVPGLQQLAKQRPSVSVGSHG